MRLFHQAWREKGDGVNVLPVMHIWQLQDSQRCYCLHGDSKTYWIGSLHSRMRLKPEDCGAGSGAVPVETTPCWVGRCDPLLTA